MVGLTRVSIIYRLMAQDADKVSFSVLIGQILIIIIWNFASCNQTILKQMSCVVKLFFYFVAKLGETEDSCLKSGDSLVEEQVLCYLNYACASVLVYDHVPMVRRDACGYLRHSSPHSWSYW